MGLCAAIVFYAAHDFYSDGGLYMRKCPICGYENSDNSQFCLNCAAPLTDAEKKQKPAADLDDLFGSGSFDDEESTSPVSSYDSFDEDGDVKIFEGFDDKNDVHTVKNDSAAHEQTDSDTASSADDTEGERETDFAENNVEEEKADETEQSENDNMPSEDNDNPADSFDSNPSGDDAEQYDDFGDNDRYVSSARTKKGKEKPVREGSLGQDLVFIAAMAVLTAVVIMLCIVYIRQTFPGNTLSEKINYIYTSTFTDGIITSNPTIEADKTSDGEDAVRITVYAKRGCVVCFREGQTYMERTVEGQSIAFRVPTSLWTAQHKGEDITSLDIVPNVFVYDPSRSNEVIQLEFAPYNTALQAVEINITTPSSESFTTSSLAVAIEGSVSDPSAAVFMNGNQLQLDENGFFRTTYHITGDKSGEYTLTFTAQKSGYAVGKKVITVKYNKSDIPLEIYNEELRTFEGSIEITGKVNKGVELSISGVETDGEINIDRSGRFSFTALIPTVGNYAVTFNLKDGKEESETVIYIEHAPDRERFVSEASHFDYDWLVNHPTMNKKLGITGTVVEIYQTEPYVRARLHTSSGDVIFTYYHTTEVATNDSKTYRIYCTPDGTDAETGLPMVYCWFIYKS